MRIEIPELCLVAMVGATSSGKSSFAKKHFFGTQVLSSDRFRAMLCDDENDQSVTDDAFQVLHEVARKRLDLGKLTVIDATNLRKEDRRGIVELAKSENIHAAAIVLDLPEEVIRRRNEARGDRNLPDKVIRRHLEGVKQSVRNLKNEGFRFVYVLDSEEAVNNAEIVLTKLWNNRRAEHGPFDIIGDVHGCIDELTELLDKLDYTKDDNGLWSHPEGRKAVFVGDLCDRGPGNVAVLRLVMKMVQGGTALCVAGNHDNKLERYLKRNKVQVTHGLEQTVKELEKEDISFQIQVREFLGGMISHFVLDDGKLVVAHAGIRQEYIGRASARVRDFCLYGDTTGETDDLGLPVRRDWAHAYRGTALIVYGHTPRAEVREENRTFNIDTGCVFGGKLSCLRYPEVEIVSIDAHRIYYEPVRPFAADEAEGRTDREEVGAPGSSADGAEGLLNLADYDGKKYIETMPGTKVCLSAEQSAAAIEQMSRYAIDPRWLIYLPPTMSPCETSGLPDYLEHPTEAFAYFHKRGMEKVMCERKHMGSRAVIVLCRNKEAAHRRFGTGDDRSGVIYTRTGRVFFEDPAVETAVLDRLNRTMTEHGFWEEFDTDWVCVDAEILPWSEKAQGLLRTQYGPVGIAGRQSLKEATEAIRLTKERMAGQNDEAQSKLEALLSKYQEKESAISGYVDAYRQYCWHVSSIDDWKIAPFHLLACEGKVFSDQTHSWHMEMLQKYCTGTDPLFLATEHLLLDLTDEADWQKGVDWWLALTANGGEGMVVKPETFVARSVNQQLLQPAVKCRGREYLRIIYGPEYLMPEHLQRLKKRSLNMKRSLAMKEFALGLEALNRTVRHEPLYRIHECVLGVLALESEQVDPRL